MTTEIFTKTRDTSPLPPLQPGDEGAQTPVGTVAKDPNTDELVFLQTPDQRFAHKVLAKEAKFDETLTHHLLVLRDDGYYFEPRFFPEHQTTPSHLLLPSTLTPNSYLLIGPDLKPNEGTFSLLGNTEILQITHVGEHEGEPAFFARIVPHRSLARQIARTQIANSTLEEPTYLRPSPALLEAAKQARQRDRRTLIQRHRPVATEIPKD